jgi:hypothetical protein
MVRPVKALTQQEVEEWLNAIDDMSQAECVRLQRFAPPGHPVFSFKPLYEYFQAHFKKMGGMTPQVSKFVGWGNPT